jgi:mannan endo-1,4-beta-mannosidase
MKYLPLFLMALCAWCTPDLRAQTLENFITRQGDKLMDGNREYRFVSFNIPNLLVIEDAFEPHLESPWRWPDEYEIRDALESTRQMGGQVVRTYVISVFRAGSDMGQTVHVLGPGKFNEEGFKTLDKVLQIANRKGIRLIIPFFDKAPWMGGQPQYAEFRGKKADEFWTDPQLIADFKQVIAHVINRKNTITGVSYKDDKAILGWETGNEIDATPEWTHEIAGYIRELDPNHLVIDGRSLHGVEQWQVDEPNTDVLTTHHYPWGANTDFVPPIRAAHAMTKGKKPYFVGEFGFVPAPQLKAVLETVVADDITGALGWSLRFHSRDGGFYWHMEVGLGGNFYKAFHWPGFASGEAYDETEVLTMMRDKAFEIQGISPPAIKAPAPPRLLPIDDVSAISWQGSTGAASYDVQRADNENGPWSTVGSNVSDADVQYRALFNNDSAEPGKSYYYAVVARNSGGTSSPSNKVGPVKVTQRTLVDNCLDLKRVAKVDGDVQFFSGGDRQTREDAHRLKLAPGSSVTYKVDEPIARWQAEVYFSNKEQRELNVSASADGKAFTPCQVFSAADDSASGDYGYLHFVWLSSNEMPPDARFLRLEFPASDAEDAAAQVGRVVIHFGRIVE